MDGSIKFDTKINSDNVAVQMQKIIDIITRLSDRVDGLEKNIINEGKLRLELQSAVAEVESAMGEIEKETAKTADKIEKHLSDGFGEAENSSERLASKIKKLFAGVVTGYTGKALIKYLIGSNAEMEQYITAFATTLGSVEDAQRLMSNIADFAKETPLQLDGLMDTAQLLLAYGVSEDNLIEKMRQTGDLAQGNQEKMTTIAAAYGKMFATAKVDWENLKIMLEAGVPILQTLADMYGVTTAEMQEMISAGRVGLPDLDRAMQNLTADGGMFAGAMENQSQTMTGMISNLMDTFEQFGRDVGEKAFEEVKDTLAEIMDTIDEMSEDGTLDEVAEELGNGINAFVTALIELLKYVYAYKEGIAIAFATNYTIKNIAAVIDTLNNLKKVWLGLSAVVKANAAIISGAGLAIVALIGIIKLCTYAMEAQHRQWETAQENYKNAAEEVEGIENELQKVKDRIAEINSGPLTVTTDEELARLQQLNDELESELHIKQKIAALKASEADEATINILGGDGSVNGSLNAVKEVTQKYNETLDELKGLNDPTSIKLYKDNLEVSLKGKEEQLLGEIDRMMEYRDALLGDTEEIRRLKEEIAGLVAEADGLVEEAARFNSNDVKENIAATTADYYRQIGEAALAASEANKKTLDDYISDLNKRRNVGMVTDEAYYAQLEKLLKNHGQHMMGEYNSYWANIVKYKKSVQDELLQQQEAANAELLKEQEAAQKESFSAWSSSLTTLISESRSKLSSIQNEIDSLKESLLQDDLFTYEDFGSGDELVLTDLAQSVEKLEEYRELLNAARDAGASDSFLSSVTAMGIDEATDYLRQVLDGNTELYLSDFEAYQEKAAEIANEYYADGVDKVQTDFIDKVAEAFGTIPDETYRIGADAAAAFVSGLSDSEDVFSAVQSLLGEDYSSTIANLREAVMAEQAYTSSRIAQSSGLVDARGDVVVTGGSTTVSVPVYLDGEKIAEHVVEITEDIEYREG